MRERPRARLAASCGALSVVLLIVGNEIAKIGGDSPALHDSPRAYADAVGTPAASIVGAFVVVVGLCLLVPFVVSLADTLRPTDGGDGILPSLVVGGGLLTAAVGLAAQAPLAAAGVLADDGQLEPVLAKALGLMNGSLFVVMWTTTAIYVGATATLVLRTRALPRFIGWTGALLAPALLVGSLAVWEYEAAFLAWALTMLWIIATSITAAARAGKRRSQPAQARRPNQDPSQVSRSSRSPVRS